MFLGQTGSGRSAAGRISWASDAVSGALVPLGIVGAWAVASAQKGVFGLFLATPGEVATEFVRLLWSGELVSHVLASLSRVAVGLVTAILVGVPLGIGMGAWRSVDVAIAPLLNFLRPIPIAAWVPLVVLVFGIGELPARVLVFMGAIHPMVVNTILGVRGVRLLHVRAARMLGANNWQVVRRVLIPSALPSVLAGIRLGLGIAWWVVIVAELLAVRSGLGYMMVQAMALLRSDTMMVGIFVIGVVGLGLNRFAILTEELLMPWRKV